MMLHDLLLFQKNCLDIINQYFWNSPAKQMNSFDCIRRIFFIEKNNR